MILTIKKRVLILCFSILVGICLCVASISIIPSLAYKDNNINKTIVLDAGHGGIDGGVVGNISQVKESEINLSICKFLRDYLIEKGYNVIMTRKNDNGLYSLHDKNKKQSDMRKRKEIINNQKVDLVVSIHQNFYPLTSVKGAQVFYDKNSETSKTFAHKTQDILNSNLACNRCAKTGDYFILQCSPYPSLLIECGFLSNPEEEQKLIKGDYQQKVAYTIFTAINSILLSDEDIQSMLEI